MTEKIVLIGAGSVVFTRGIIADLIRRNEKIELALVDIDSKALKIAQGLAKKMIANQGSPIALSGTTDRKKALKNATVVITTIGVGGRKAWEKDVYIPRKYGIYQPVGDSVMPGGTSRALRMIGAMVDIARDVIGIAPKALFFNYGNPMSAICRGVRKATGAEIIGLCHGVFNSGNNLAHLLGVNPSELRYTAIGVNHLTWFTRVKVGEKDAFPKMSFLAEDAFKNACMKSDLGKHFWEAGTEKRGTSAPHHKNLFCWQLFKIFNAYPVPGDRHACEFFGRMFASKNSYFGRTLGVDSYSFEHVIKYGNDIYAEHGKLALGRKPLPAEFLDSISGEHEQVTDIIESIRLNKGKSFSANLPNDGQVTNFPKDAIVESPAIADAYGIKPVHQGAVSAAIAGTLATRFQWVETVVEAALEGSREKFIQALILDGAVTSADQAAKMAAELLKAHAEYLPKFK